MAGILLILFGSAATEVAWSIGKREAEGGRQSIFTMGILDLLGSVVFFAVLTAVDPSAWRFDWASLPTFALRAALEIVQIHVTMLAILRADRSTYGFVRLGTIPLLLGTDTALGYTLTNGQIGGTVLIVATLAVLLWRGLRTAGIQYVVIGMVNAALTLSLFKYNITHFNSIVAEQTLISLFPLGYCIVMAHAVAKENPLLLVLRRPTFLLQGLAAGIGSVAVSFGFGFLPASVATTIQRTGGLFWAVLSGSFTFRERHLLFKLVAVALCGAGLALMAW